MKESVTTDIEETLIDKKPILILSTARRLWYFTETLNSLVSNIDNIHTQFDGVWLLDDRSSLSDRNTMETMLRGVFFDKFTSIYFNNNDPYRFIDKLNIIKSIVSTDDVVLYVEDDWRLSEPFDVQYHTKQLLNNRWTQISFCDPIDIQNTDIKNNYIINDDYWKNPYPLEYVHPYKWGDGFYLYTVVRMKHWNNNPSLVKGYVYHANEFEYDKNFEAIFADSTDDKLQVFHQKCLFYHIGEDSLINNL
jgi:hypothetical protein